MRRTKTIVIDAAGRYTGKVFRLTELPSEDTFLLIADVVGLMIRTGMQIPPGVTEAGLPRLVELGMLSLGNLSVDDLKPIIDAVMSCVQFVPEGGAARALEPEDIEEFGTRVLLKREVIALHNFAVQGTVREIATAEVA